MLFRIDFHGTIVGNPAMSWQAWRKVLNALNDSGHGIVIWSGDPLGISNDWSIWFDDRDISIEDKGLVHHSLFHGTVVIDDLTSILTMAARAGAITVPAEQAAAFFKLLGV
jgi:hypothetical protein